MVKIKQLKKEKRIYFSLTKQQDFIIRQKAAKAGLTIHDYLRQMAMIGQVKSRWTAEELHMVRRLTSIFKDIHEVVEHAQKEGAFEGVRLFTKYTGILHEIVNSPSFRLNRV